MNASFDGYLRDLFAGLGPIALRGFFGGRGIYHQGLILGMVMGEDLYLKTDAQSAEKFRQAGGQPFVYQSRGRSVTTSYWTPPVEAMESAQAMQPWAQLAFAAARSKQVGSGRKSRSGKKSD